MFSMRKSLLNACLLPLLTGAAAADPIPLALTSPPPLIKNIAAFPKIADHGAAADKINQALDKLDQNALQASKNCLAAKGGAWSREIDVTSRGARFLSYKVTDDRSCGAYPDSSVFALVYDLTTGDVVDWAKLLPHPTIETSSLATAAEGSKIAVVGSRILSKFYVDHLGKHIDPDCIDVLASTDLQFIFWVDSSQGGVTMQTVNLPHVVQACADTVTMSLDTLKEFHANKILLDGL